MKFLVILLFIIVPYSFQTIQAAFYCEDILPNVYLVDKSTGITQSIGSGTSVEWSTPNIFTNLAADQGDTIKIDCDSTVESDTSGGGCFLINNNCHCYDFNTREDSFHTIDRTTELDGKPCSLSLRRSQVPSGLYSYTYIIPLDPNGITCPTGLLTFRYGEDFSLDLTQTITANFGLKNLEISIIENYKYFKLNGVQLESNNRFKILAPNLVFNSEESKKISVKFTNFGIKFSNKDCILNIRVCYQRCLDCYDSDSDDNNHQCKKCKEGYYPCEDNYDCKTKEEMIGTNYFFDEDAKIFKRCYRSCALCNSKSMEIKNNCIECADKYHFIYNELEKGTCIHETQKPINTYLDLNDNTYKLCYERCSKCSQGGDITSNNCDECSKDNNENYIYHFLPNDNGKCITEIEKPLNTYLDLNDNTYKYCYDRCSLCDKRGDESSNNCKECLKDTNNNYLYHFIYNEEGRCLNESEKPPDTYLDSETNTYKKCYERCSSCDEGGDESKNNCKECLKDENRFYRYHFIYNETGRCLSEDEKPSNTVLDVKDNTYKLFSEICSSCDKNNNCIECFREYKIIENILEMKEDFIQIGNNITFHITTSDEQKNNPIKNISSINLRNCENILKEKYDINETFPLIIFKIDYYPPNTLIPIVEYEIYHPINYSKLDLSYCENTFIKINVPVSLDENNMFKYDPESDYYDDYCNPYTNDDGTDILINDRRKLFVKNYLSLCQNNCEFVGYNKDNKQSTCNCITENKMDNISVILDDSNKLEIPFKIEKEIPGFGSNVKTIKCTHILYTKDGLKKNISSYFLLTFISIFISAILLYIKFGYRLIQNKIKKILESKKNIDLKKNNEQITYTNMLKVKNSFTNNKRRINSMANYPPKKNISKEPSINSDIKIVDYNSQNENSQKSKFSVKDGEDKLTLNNKKKKGKKIIDDNISEFGQIQITKRDKEEKDKNTFNDYELNSFKYSEALSKDKRKYYEYYLSLIKRNQLIAFTFFPIKDYNLKVIKICIFCLSFSLYYTTNYFYFSEKVIHKIYEDKGKYDFSYYLPKIITAFFVAYFLTVIIKFIFLSERNILQIKLQNTYFQANKIAPKIKRKVSIKYIVFFTIGIILLIFLWMLLSSFGAVFRNTQIILFENTLISFATSLIYPFIYDIIPCFFRILSLHYRKENLYKVSLLLQLL